MPNVRHTPKRRRDTCPGCGRDISYTTHRIDFVSTYFTKTFANHNGTDGKPCSVEPIRVQTRRS